MRRILAVPAVLLVLAVTVELAFGTWFSKDPLDHSDLGRNSTMAVSAAALYPGGQDFTYRRDGWGFRGAGLDPAKVTVLTVGGSTTDQRFLPDEQTWQSVMEREFRAAGLDAVVANAGIHGQATSGHVRAFEDWFGHLPGLRPRFVLFSVGLDETSVPAAESSSGQWVRYSGLLRVADRLSEVKMLEPQPVDQPEGRPNRAGIAAYKERLTRLAQQAHSMGAVPVFVVQGVWDETTARRLADFNHATRAVCKEAGLLCLDLAREVTFEPGDFYDHLHNSPQGAEKVGRWLAGKLAGLV